MLNAIKEQGIPLLPYFMNGTNTSHAKRPELTGYSDQVNVPDIATSQMEHTITPVNRNIENDIKRVISGQLKPFSHFETALSVIGK